MIYVKNVLIINYNLTNLVIKMSASKVSICVEGGLGNQLFKIFTILSYGIKYNKRL